MATKSALQSKGVWGGIIASIAGIWSFAHSINFVGLAQAIADNWQALTALGGGLLAIYGRIRASTFIAPKPTVSGVARIAIIGLLIPGLFGAGLTSCQTPPGQPVIATVAPGSDPVVVHAEQVYQEAFDTFDTIYKLDAQDRAYLLKYAPAVHQAINDLKPRSKVALSNVKAVLSAYKKNRTAEQKANLDTYLATLQATLDEARKYQAQLPLGAP